MAKEILCGFGIDVDAVAGWLGSYGGEDSPDDISRGLFAGEVGSPRLLGLGPNDIRQIHLTDGRGDRLAPRRSSRLALRPPAAEGARRSPA